jgi:hypothetical protein
MPHLLAAFGVLGMLLGGVVAGTCIVAYPLARPDTASRVRRFLRR